MMALLKTRFFATAAYYKYGKKTRTRNETIKTRLNLNLEDGPDGPRVAVEEATAMASCITATD